MKKLIIYTALLFTVVAIAQTQNNQFDVIHDGKLLGTLTASKKTDGATTTYTSHTNIEYHLMLTITVVYDYYVVFNNSVLKEATAHIVVRGDDKTKVKTIKEGNVYKYYSEGELEKTISSPLNHSVVQLLFEEPTDIIKVYAEEHGEYHSLKKVGEHSYLKTAPNGHKNTYHYKNGTLQKSDVDAGVIKFSIVRKN